MLWAVIGALALIGGGALALPLIRGSRDAAARAEYDARVYRDQLEELDRDAARGTLSAEEASSARTEIARRLLAADEAAKRESERTRGTAPAATTGLIVALAVPAGALALYGWMGSPSLPGQPALQARAERAALEEQARQADPAELLARLAKVLEDRPDDRRGWALYARSLVRMGRYADAGAAYERLIALDPKDADIRSEYAEALILAADGRVTEKADAAIEAALALDPKEPRARFYSGLAAQQAGRNEEAIRLWYALAADSPPEAPWREIIETRVADLAKAAGIDAARLAALREDAGAGAPRGPSADDVEAAQRLSAEDRQAMIHSMVDGLAGKMKDDPDNVEGWLRLGRSYAVLQDFAKSRDAYARAAALRPDDAEILSRYAQAIARAADPGEALPPTLAAVSERLLALQPDHGAALWFSGVAKAQEGDAAGARERWTQLLALLDPDSQQYAQVKARLDALPAEDGSDAAAPAQ